MRKILVTPIITEKSMQDAAHGRYTFMADIAANKNQIATSAGGEI